MSDTQQAHGEGDAFSLRGRAPIVLHATGLRHPRSSLFGGEVFTSYADVTHVALGARGLRLATRSGSFGFRRSAFRTAGDAAVLAQRLRERIGTLPGGREQLERMAALDRRLVAPLRPRLGRNLVLLCVLAFALQHLFFPQFEYTGMLNAELVRGGELWRLVTANFLHGGISHLALNALGLLVLGSLLEVILGLPAAAFVVAASAFGAMGAGLLADYLRALGASGIVAGIVGALLWLEFRRPGAIPAPWRLPRRLLVGAVVADAVLLAFVPMVAHAAHAGGFLAGIAAVALAVPAGAGAPARRRWLGPANAGAAALGALAALGLVWAVWAPGTAATQRRAERLLAIEGVHPTILNNEAWLIAISEEPAGELLEIARRLAERAVAATGGVDPNVLDTLAEVYFAAGATDRAVATIDEAIALAPHEPYFREQRRRFTGERAPDDRPHPPQAPGIPMLPPPAPEQPPGLRV